MKLAIMQPYLFPYIGYFQLMNLADTFVVYDDVQFIKGGWINRNNILVSGSKKMFNLSLRKDSTFANINERFLDETKFDKEVVKFLRTIVQSYSKAPFFKETHNLLEDIFSCKERGLSEFITNSLMKINEYLGIKTSIKVSSKLSYDKDFKAQERVLSLCASFMPKFYINPIGGVDLYSKEMFQNNNIELFFVKTKEINYAQFNKDFEPNLSIIDVMMFNSVESIQEMLTNFELI
ncbi:MAG: WbqC family protein [Marinifilaceae bacterium]